MPVKESEFSLASLWPPSNFHWMAPGAVASTAAIYGPGFDLGALRVRNGIWEILVTKTPTQADQSNSEWIAFDPSNAQHLFNANAFNRYGRGWSYGPGHNLHDEHVAYITEYNAAHSLPPPSNMDIMDVAHDRSLWNFYSAWATGGIPTPVDPAPKPEPKPKPVDPAPKPIDPTVPKPVEPPSATIERLTAQLLKAEADRDSYKSHFEAADTEVDRLADEVTRLKSEIERLLHVVPTLPPLSPADQRAEELWSMAAPVVKLFFVAFRWDQAGQKVKQVWIVGKPLAVVLIESWRRR